MYHDINRDIDLTLEELEEANAMDHERQRENALDWEMCERAGIEAAIAAGAKLRVRRTEGAFEIVLRLKGAQNLQIALRSLPNHGGLFTDDRSAIFYPYEFSMHRYQYDTNVRAATEYVRRKLLKFRA